MVRLRSSTALDERSFTDLLRRHDDRMRALAHGMLGSAAAMDDALQDAYLRAWRARDTFRGEAASSTWLHRIVVNTCIDHLRRRRPVLTLEGHDVSDPGERHEARITDNDALSSALGSLPVDQRVAVLLVDGDGRSYVEAGELLDVPKGTIASRVHRGRAELRRLLSDDGEVRR